MANRTKRKRAGREPNGVAPAGDGRAYESMRQDVRGAVVDTRELQRRAVWVPASPFVIHLVKELIVRLIEISNLDGTEFLCGLGIDSVEELDQLNEMHADSIIELLDHAVLSIPADRLKSLGYGDSVLGMRRRAQGRHDVREACHANEK